MAYIGKQPTIGNFVKLDAITTSATTTFNLTNGGVAYYPQSANHCLVSLNGILQAPTDSFTISGSTIIFSSALTTSDVIDFIIVLGDVLNIGTPSDNTVSLAKLTATGTKDSTTFLRGDNTFSTVSSDYVRLATTTVSSSVSEVNFTTGFSDTYKIYELEFMNVDLSAAAYIFFRWGYGVTPTYVTSGYIDYSMGITGNTSSGFTGKNTYNRTTAHSVNTGDHTLGNTTGYTMNGKIRLFNCRSTSTYFKGFNSQVMYLHSGVDFGSAAHTCGFNSDTTLRDSAVTGFKLYTDTGNFDGGTFVLYGIKTS